MLLRRRPLQGPNCGACGTAVSADGIRTYSRGEERFVFYRCSCGSEWTDQLPGVDRSHAVSADEVLDVHQRLLFYRGGLKDLISGGGS